jgi:hypothetical protein
MPGALLQLVSVGKEDVYLVGNPQFSYFSKRFRQHTNFSMEDIPLYFAGKPDFGQQLQITVPIHGDLLSNLTLQLEIPALPYTSDTSNIWNGVGYSNSLGHALIEDIYLEINDEIIDRFGGDWLEIYSELFIPESKQLCYRNMIAKQSNNYYTSVGFLQSDQINGQNVFFIDGEGCNLYVPLPFWFTRDIAQSIPMVALQNTSVKLTVKLRPLEQVLTRMSYEVTAAPLSDDIAANVQDIQTVLRGIKMRSASLIAEYIYLDADERRLFSSKPHEYLIENVQYIRDLPLAAGQTDITFKLPFNRPVKEVFWVCQRQDSRIYNEHFNWSHRLLSEQLRVKPSFPIDKVMVKLNGIQRYEQPFSQKFFNYLVPYLHNIRCPNNFIFCMSFALFPQQHQPSGTLNCSRITDFDVIVKMLDPRYGPISLNSPRSHGWFFNFYATGYNVLRINSGTSKLVYFN